MWVRIPYFQNIITNCPYSYVSNHYNLLVSKKHRFKSITFNKSTIKIVKILYRSGVITNFIVTKNLPNNKQPNIKFTVLFYKNSSFFKKIKLISTPSKQFFVTKTTLKLSQKVFKTSLIIISTNKGLLTHQEAIALGLGGKVIYIIN